MNKLKNILKNSIMMVVIPVITYFIFFILTELKGVEGFGVGTDLVVIFRNTVYTGFIALAVSYNLTSGRFDFSVGATLILATTIASMLTLQYNLGALEMLILALFFGGLLGGIGGYIYTLLRLPPMVVSLGVAMIYEAIGFLISGGSGVKLIGRNDLLIWAHNPYVYLLCAVIVFVLYIILNYTKFGYNTNSLRTGQELAVNVGVNEKINTIMCYVIAGVCLGAAGVINLSILGTVVPKLSLASAAYVQSAFMPMFIGGLLAKYFDRNVGVIMGSLTQSIIYAGIGKLGVPSAWQSVITGVIVLIFFAYAFNAYRIAEYKLFKDKKAKAVAKLAVSNE